MRQLNTGTNRDKTIALYLRISREDAGKLAPENMKVCEKKFPLGGFELIARDEKKFFDARLDSRLTQMRQDFINLFDITV